MSALPAELLVEIARACIKLDEDAQCNWKRGICQLVARVRANLDREPEDLSSSSGEEAESDTDDRDGAVASTATICVELAESSLEDGFFALAEGYALAAIHYMNAHPAQFHRLQFPATREANVWQVCRSLRLVNKFFRDRVTPGMFRSVDLEATDVEGTSNFSCAAHTSPLQG